MGVLAIYTVTTSRSGLKKAERKLDKAGEDYAIISVRGIGERRPYLVQESRRLHRIDSLFLVFDDICPTRGHGTLMKEHHAKSIVDFVERNSDKIIICQCEAGQSRSFAIAAAIQKHLYDDSTLSEMLPSDASKYVYDMIGVEYETKEGSGEVV
mgnify:CR=1 FL=1